MIRQTSEALRGPGGVVGLDLGGWAKISARELASVASRGLQGPLVTTHHQHLQPTTYHLPPPTTTTYHHPSPIIKDQYNKRNRMVYKILY